ncbi:hypothetical protein KQX54_019891 [Cotesia glomerata]|uniref:Uncharacterized protein n=1 Tax=Cotesia glomerata TaxID=32391 RepID=A0AAV7HUQ0_COTGL|nr:hypothetical protein KQX54_019891 [Cotesia glomerata]
MNIVYQYWCELNHICDRHSCLASLGRNSWPGRDSGLHIGARSPSCPLPTFLQLLPRALGALREEKSTEAKSMKACATVSPPNRNTNTKTKRPSLLHTLLTITCFYSCTFSSLGPLTLALFYRNISSELQLSVGAPLFVFGATTGPMSSLESSCVYYMYIYKKERNCWLGSAWGCQGYFQYRWLVQLSHTHTHTHSEPPPVYAMVIKTQDVE